MNIAVTFGVKGRDFPVTYYLQDKSILPRPGDRITITAGLPTPLVVERVELRWELDDAIVTLSDLDPVSDGDWEAIHDSLMQETPGPLAPKPPLLAHPFVPPDRMGKPPRIP